MSETVLEQDADEKKWARRAHLSTLITYPLALLPFPLLFTNLGTILFPFVIWLSRKKLSYSAKQSLEAIYLQAILTFGFFGFGDKFANDRVLMVFSYVFLSFLHAILLGIGIFRTTIGKPHSYPFSFFPFLFSNSTTKENWNELKKKIGDKEVFAEFKTQMEKLDSLRVVAEKEVKSLNDSELQTLGNEYVHSLSDLRIRLTEEPTSLKKAKQFLNYFPETVAKILNQYNKVSRDNTASDQQKRKDELKQLLSEVIKTSEQVRQKLRADETLNLDVEITAMKKNIEFGGY